MDAVGRVIPSQAGQQQQPPSPVEGSAAPKAERLNAVVVQQLNLESMKTRAIGLSKTISRILLDFDAYALTNSTPRWQDVLGQFSMVSMELFNIVEDINNVSKAFVVHPRNVNAENATILPVMLSSKLLPEMETEDSTKREQLLYGISNLPVNAQIDKLKARIDMIGSACDAAEKVIVDCRRAFGLSIRQGTALLPTLDKVQAAKIQEQENQLRAAANIGEGLRIPLNQRQLPASLPDHLADLMSVGYASQNHGINSSVDQKNTPSSNLVYSQGAMFQNSGSQLLGRSVQSPSVATTFDNVSTPPIPYANSPRSSINIMNTPSPQQQTQQLQQRQKMMQLPQHKHQLLAQQQLMQSSTMGPVGQGTISQLHDLAGQSQQKFHQAAGQHAIKYSQAMSQQQFQNRQLASGHIQHNISQNQINQGTQLRNHLSQFTGVANSALFNAAQSSPNSQMVKSISVGMQPQSVLPRMQFGLSAGHPQRNLPSQVLNDQSGTGPASMMTIQQQQQDGFGNIPTNNQNLQSGMVGLQNTTQNRNF